jgi:colanic acid biosynthesis protein WcaH
MIDKKTYKKILDLMPIICVDLVLYHKGKILLAKRVNEPAKGMWWIPGGRVLKNERLTDAVKRKAKEELGIDIIIKKVIGIYEIRFKNGPIKGIKDGIHDISINFLVGLKNKKTDIKLDRTNKKYIWIDNINSSLHPYVKEVIYDCKLFDDKIYNKKNIKFNIIKNTV